MMMDLQESNETIAIRSGVGKFFLIQNMLEDCIKYNLELFPMNIIMPCGCEYEYKDYEHFPERTVSCGCGDDKHKVVEYMLH